MGWQWTNTENGREQIWVDPTEETLTGEEVAYASLLREGEKTTYKKGFIGMGKKTIERKGNELIVRGTFGGVHKKVKVEPAGGCFIASVVYGGVHMPEVQILREFRDSVLNQYVLGRAFVRFYYCGFGKFVASLIENHLKFIIPIIKISLDVVTQSYSKRRR